MDVNQFSRLTDDWASVWQRDRIPGLAICVRDSSGIIFNKAYGVHDRTTGQPFKSDSVFPIASQSKTFTALAVLQLVHEKKHHPLTGRPLGLDDHITDLLSHLKVDWLQGVTLRDALAHRTRFRGGDSGSPSSADLRAINMVAIEPAAEAGYSNKMYNQLSLLIEDVSGRAFNDYIRTEIVEKHSLGEIYPSLNAVPPAQRERIPIGYSGENLDIPVRDEDAAATAPSGGFYATAKALTGFYRKLARGEILPGHKADQNMATGMFECDVEAKRKAGLGILVDSINDKNDDNPYYVPNAAGNLYGHTGGLDGYQGETRYHPQTDLTVTVFRTGFNVDSPADRNETDAAFQKRMQRDWAWAGTPLVMTAVFRSVLDSEHTVAAGRPSALSHDSQKHNRL